MAARKKQFLVPFSLDGRNQLHYGISEWVPDASSPSGYSQRGLNQQPNRVFRARLRITDYRRGRSAAFFALERVDTDDIKNPEAFTMFLTDMLDVILHRTIEHTAVESVWTFCKRGANYGVRLANVEEAGNLGGVME